MTMEQHLTPEVFVDFIEGSPVDASWRAHLDECRACRVELTELERTLAVLRADTDATAPLAAPPRTRVAPAWLGVAAAVVLLSVGAAWLWVEKTPTATTSVPLEELLPPVEQDDEFRFLLAVSDANDVELFEVSEPAFDGFELDPGRLTPSQRQQFVERLTEEMRSSL